MFLSSFNEAAGIPRGRLAEAFGAELAALKLQ